MLKKKQKEALEKRKKLIVEKRKDEIEGIL